MNNKRNNKLTSCSALKCLLHCFRGTLGGSGGGGDGGDSNPGEIGDEEYTEVIISGFMALIESELKSNRVMAVLEPTDLI